MDIVFWNSLLTFQFVVSKKMKERLTFKNLFCRCLSLPLSFVMPMYEILSLSAIVEKKTLASAKGNYEIWSVY